MGLMTGATAQAGNGKRPPSLWTERWRSGRPAPFESRRDAMNMDVLNGHCSSVALLKGSRRLGE